MSDRRATLRLFTLPECITVAADKSNALDPWPAAADYAMATVWQGDVLCLVCDRPINRCAAYAALVVPHDPFEFDCQCFSGGVCVACGAAQSRAEIYRHVNGHATLSLGEVAGHA
jgi:hypothetical protein